MSGGWADRQTLPKGPTGRNLCRWCNLEVPKGRSTFCSAWCVEEWRLRSDPGYVREKILERDRGICASCGVDCLHAERQLKRLRGAARLKAILDWVSTPARGHLSGRLFGTPIISFRLWKAEVSATFKTFAPYA
jgi:5-methylcytosine-specific restriction protein A